MRTKSLIIMTMLLALVAVSCRTIATATPDEIDPAAIEASIRSQILTTYPGETFDIGISVTDEGVVTFTGTVDSAEHQRRIPELAQDVSGVTRIINRLGVRR